MVVARVNPTRLATSDLFGVIGMNIKTCFPKPRVVLE
jgi:hypothetical protein